MIFKIQRKSRDFFQVSNSVVEQPGMSFKAKGVLCYLLSKPESWVPRVGEISKLGPDGRESIQTALQELSGFGYASLESERSDSGQLSGKVWTIYEDPGANPQFTDERLSPLSVVTDERLSRQTANPSDGKPDTSNTQLEITLQGQQHSLSLMDRLGKMMNRRSSTGWSETELRELKKVNKLAIPDDEIALLERYYGSDSEILRRDLQTLLRNIMGEIDRAKKYFSTNGRRINGTDKDYPKPNPRNAGICGDREAATQRVLDTLARRKAEQSANRVATAQSELGGDAPGDAGGG